MANHEISTEKQNFDNRSMALKKLNQLKELEKTMFREVIEYDIGGKHTIKELFTRKKKK